MNNTVLSMIGMKPKYANKLDTVPLDKKYPEETVLPEDGSYIYFHQPGEQHGDQKRRAADLIWSKLYKNQVIVSCAICRTDPIELLYVKN